MDDMPVDIKRIIYTHFLLRLRSEKHFNLLRCMHQSNNFRMYAICDIIPEIRYPSKYDVTIKIINEIYQMEIKLSDSWLFDVNIRHNLRTLHDQYDGSGMFVLLMHIMCSLGGDYLTISSNNGDLKMSTEANTTYALMNVKNFTINDVSLVAENKKVGLYTADIIKNYPCYINSDSERFPTYTFPKKCEKISIHKEAGYIFGPSNIQHVNWKDSDHMVLPQTEFTSKIIVSNELLMKLYKCCTKKDVRSSSIIMMVFLQLPEKNLQIEMFILIPIIIWTISTSLYHQNG